jgi:hypothetical protein
MDWTNLWTLLDLLRLTGVGLVIFLLLPYVAVRGGGPRRRPWHEDMAAGLISVTFYLLFAIAALGHGRAARSGAAAVLYFAWLGGTALFARRSRWALDALPGPMILPAVLRELEDPWRRHKGLAARMARQPLLVFFTVLSTCSLAYGALSVLSTFRFLRVGDYEAALSLHSLASGAAWDGNPRVVLLAPLIWFSGLGAADALRLSAPLLLVLLAFAALACALRFAPALPSGQLAAGLGLLAWILAERSLNRQTGGAELTAIFALLAASRWRRSWGDCALALLSMGYAGIHWPVLPCVAVGAGLAALGVAVIPTAWRLRPSLAWAPVAALAVFTAQGRPAVPPETVQYESAARIAARIAREHADRDWLLISSGREATQVAGRGWHLPLTALLRYADESGSSLHPARLPFRDRHVFVMVELRPLRTGLRSLAPGSGASDYFESTDAGRATLHFKAARFMERYAAVHREVDVFYHDEDIIVFHFPGAS